jgi:uncharacterized protein YndB with AHSA1/START domain
LELAPEASTAIGLTRRFAAPASVVFRSFIDPVQASRWLFATAHQKAVDVRIDARAGGSFLFAETRRGARVLHRGRYFDVRSPNRLAFMLCCDDLGPVQTRVEIEIESVASECTIALVHDRIPRARAAYARDRWIGMLYGLGELLDGARHDDWRRSDPPGRRDEPANELR